MTKNLSNKGFTLLEVMIAVALVAIALTALLGSQSQSVSFANSAKFETMAALLAQSKMSEIAIQEKDSLSSGSGDFGEDYPGFAWEAAVSDISTVGGSNISDYLKQIDLTVTWGVLNYNLRLYHYVGETHGGGSDNVFTSTKRTGIKSIRIAQNYSYDSAKDLVGY